MTSFIGGSLGLADGNSVLRHIFGKRACARDLILSLLRRVHRVAAARGAASAGSLIQPRSSRRRDARPLRVPCDLRRRSVRASGCRCRARRSVRRRRDQRDDDFGSRGGIARDVIRERVDVAARPASARVCAARPHTPRPSAMRTHAGLPWNGPTTSSPSVMKVEAGPVQVRQRVIEKGGEIRGVGDAVRFTGEQRAGLLARVLRSTRPSASVAETVASNIDGVRRVGCVRGAGSGLAGNARELDMIRRWDRGCTPGRWLRLGSSAIFPDGVSCASGHGPCLHGKSTLPRLAAFHSKAYVASILIESNSTAISAPTVEST